SEALLLTLKNLMRQAHDREQRGEAAPQPGKAPERPPERVPHRPKARAVDSDGEIDQDAVRPAVKLNRGSKPPARVRQESQAGGSLVGELERLVSLRQQGLLTEEEFQTLKQRLVAGASGRR